MPRQACSFDRWTTACAVAMILASLPLRAQAPLPSFPALADSLRCTYERCALSFEEPVVFAGEPGTGRAVAGRFAIFRAPDLRERVAQSDSARRYAGLVIEHHTRGAAANTVGFLLMAASVVMLYDESEERLYPSTTAISLAIASSTASLYGRWELRESRRALARTIWWYNGELPRAGEPAAR